MFCELEESDSEDDDIFRVFLLKFCIWFVEGILNW